MCFKNLPIEFDQNGKAKLLDTAGDPYGTGTPIKQYIGVGSSTNGSAASTTPPRLSGWTTN